MKISSFRDNRDSLILAVGDIMVRFDLQMCYIDLLYVKKFSHQRVIKAQPLKPIIAYDLESILPQALELQRQLTMMPHQIKRVYRHDCNDRFALLEVSAGFIEIDKDLNGIKLRQTRSVGNKYKRRPDHYYRDSIIMEYQRIEHDQKRAIESCLKIIARMEKF